MPSLAVETRTRSGPSVGRTLCRYLHAEGLRKWPDAPESPTASIPPRLPLDWASRGDENHDLTWPSGMGEAVGVVGVVLVGCTCRADWREEEDEDVIVGRLCFLTSVKN